MFLDGFFSTNFIITHAYKESNDKLSGNKKKKKSI